MKIFLAALCIFLLLFTSVFLNERMVERTMNELLAYAEAIPAENTEGRAEAIEAFDTQWQEKSFLLSLTIPRNDLEQISAEIPILSLYAEESEPEFYTAREQLIALLRQTRDQQKLSFINIL